MITSITYESADDTRTVEITKIHERKWSVLKTEMGGLRTDNLPRVMVPTMGAAQAMARRWVNRIDKRGEL